MMDDVRLGRGTSMVRRMNIVMMGLGSGYDWRWTGWRYVLLELLLLLRWRNGNRYWRRQCTCFARDSGLNNSG